MKILVHLGEYSALMCEGPMDDLRPLEVFDDEVVDEIFERWYSLGFEGELEVV